MPRLFLDCDDTLVLWPVHATGVGQLYSGDEWLPNEALIDRVRAFHAQNPDWTIVVWSGGGIDYAAMWGRRLLEGVRYIVLPKLVGIPDEGDVVVDDVPELAVSARLVLPSETWF